VRTALLAVVVMLAAVAAAVTPVSSAAAATPTTTTLAAPPQLTLRAPVTLSATVTAPAGPVGSGVVRFEQQTATGWVPIGDAALDGAGTASLQTTFSTAPVTVRASYLGADGNDPSSSTPSTMTGVPQPTTATLAAPRSVVDERTLQVSADVRTPSGPVAGAAVSFQVFTDGAWRTYGTSVTDGAGVATARSRPRSTYRYRALVTGADWFTAARTATITVRNTPPGRVVTVPAEAPRPRRIAAQPRASGDGANASIGRISSGVWTSMTGRSWRPGCPVGREQLRLVRVTYWGFDGYRHRGEIVVNKAIAAKTARAFTDLYRHRVSIRAMYRVDRFGYSSRVSGANDYTSMLSDNTSGFNCRAVVGRAGVRSPHATGRAIDINPFENPYRYRYAKWVPNTWWHTRAIGTYAWTKRSHLVPTIMRRNGFRWTYGIVDAQHFDG